MSKTVYIKRQALIDIFNTKYGANFPPDTEFILDEETVEAKIYTDYLKTQLALTEKALELACEDIFENEFVYIEKHQNIILELVENFKTKAKEMKGE